MHKFVEFQSAKAALLFADYCQSLGLQVRLETLQQGAALYAPSEQLAQIQPLLEQFLQEPGHPRYQAAAWQHSQSVSFNAERPILSLKGVWQAPLTYALILLVLLVYLWLQIDFYAATAAFKLTEPSELWRWFTPMLLHFSITHLVFNLCWWWLLGQKIEQYRSTMFLLGLTLFSAAISNGMQLLLTGPDFGGLSGVVYALFGYCWLADKLSGTKRYAVTDALAVFMVLWMLLGFMDVLWVSMANWAHLGGLLSGLVWALLAKRQ